MAAMARWILLLGISLFAAALGTASPAAPPRVTFYRQVLPILQQHCQSCHRAGEIAPMPLVTYEQTRPFAQALAQAAATGKMPPWLADRCCGKFANDPSLTAQQIETLKAWA